MLVVLLCSLLASVSFAYDSSYSLNAAKRYVQFSGAAYCADPVFAKDSINDWSCKACKNFPHVTATTFHGKVKDANGFVAYDSDANEIIVSFSGTDPLSIANWIDDLNYFQVDFPLCSGCRVDQGFYNSYLSVADAVHSLVSKFHSSHSNAKVSITGHSLGAAMAAHCAADLAFALKYNITSLYTYGMPRVGNVAFETWYKSSASRIPGTFRVVHDHDPVPHLPFDWMSQGFHHMPYEVFYTKDYTKWTLCSFDGEDPNCSDKYVTDLDVVNHLNYLDMDFTTNYLSCQV